MPRLLIGLLLWLLMLCPRMAWSQPWSLTQGDIAQGAHGATEAVGWQPVSLPDHWGLSRRSGTWTYRLRIDPCRETLPACLSHEEALTLWIPRAGSHVDIWLNGKRLAHFGALDGQSVDYASRPILVQVPHALLRATGNELRLVITGYAWRLNGLSRVWWGGYADLNFRHASRDHVVVGSAIAVISTSLLFVVAGFWSACRTRKIATWLFALAGFFWVVRELLLMTGFRWLGWDMSIWLAVMAKCITMLLASFLSLRLMSARAMSLRWLMAAELLAVPLLLALLIWDGQGAVYLARWHVLVQLTGLLVTLVSVWATLRRPTVSNLLVMSGSLGCAAIGLTDNWMFYLSGSPDGFEHIALTSFMAVFFLLSVSASMFLRVDHALKLEVAHKDALEREVSAQREELERLHTRESERMRLEAVSNERARIIRDMHDGLGSQLVGLLSTVQSGAYTQAELTSEVHEAIDQLRLTIDTLEPLGGDLASLLGQLRFRLESRLRKIGFQVDWRVDHLPGGHELDTTTLASLQRLFYEVFSNIMKHAKAHRVVVRGAHDALRGINEIVITDDGQGFDPSQDVSGRGLRNMRLRASQLGAELLISSQPGGGTRVSLSLPCGPA